MILINMSVAALTCALVAIIELRLRFSHGISNTSIFCNSPAALYILLHLLVGSFSLIIGSTTDVVSLNDHNANNFIKSFLVGMAATAVLRSSLLTIKFNSVESKIGPDALLDVLKEHIQKTIDNSQNEENLDQIYNIMKDVDPYKAKENLVVTCLSGLELLPDEDQNKLREAANLIFDNIELNEKCMSIALGHIISRQCGIKSLRNAVKILGDDIKFQEKKNLSEIDKKLAQFKAKLTESSYESK